MSALRDLESELMEGLPPGSERAPVLRRVTTEAARSPDVQVMPAKGLTLEEVGYPPDDALVARGEAARSVRTAAVPG